MAVDSSPSSCSDRLRVLDATVITPSGPALPACSLPLTILDLLWLHSPPVERLFLYRLDDDVPAEGVVSDLRASFSAALRVFFPLAGRVRVAPGTAAAAARLHEILYEPGDGVAFTFAEYDADVSDLASDEPRRVAELAQLVPRLTVDGDGDRLLAVQATVLRRGLALGVTVHHVGCDGAGSSNFLHTWAAACSGTDEFLPAAPVMDRSLIADPLGLYDHYTSTLPSTKEMEFVKMSPDNLFATFKLSTELLRSVKDAVAREAARRGQPPPRCSTLVASLGFIWSCHCRAKAETGWNVDDAEPTYFVLPVDHRQRMNPPVPATYLGNCVGPAIGAAPKKELTAGGGGSLLSACGAIAAGIEKAVASPEWETMIERVMEVGARGVLSMAGSPRFQVYDVDFGFGRPAKVEILSVARTGAVAVAESAMGTTAGIEIGISLPPPGMEAFRSSFADAVVWLRHSHLH